MTKKQILFRGMNYPTAEQRGIYKGNETPQAAGNYPSSASGGFNDSDLGFVSDFVPWA
jgi:hypothetical protein